MECVICGKDIESTMPDEIKQYPKPIRKREKCYICSPYRDRRKNKTPQQIEEIKSKRVEAVKKRRRTLKIKAVKYKGGKCQKCGYDKCVDALDFHHLERDEKDFSIGHKGHTHSWEAIKKELAKCVLLCANCHREEHAKHIC